MRALVLLAFLSPALSGCLSDGSDEGGSTPTPTGGPAPVEVPASLASMEFIANGNATPTTGIWVEDGLAYLSGGQGLRIVDVSDPANPVPLSGLIADTASRDVDLIHHPNGRLYAVLCQGNPNLHLVDVTDPRDAFLVGNVTSIGPCHNLAAVPGTTLVYNSRSISTHLPGAGETGQIDIIDYADPEDPKVTVFAFPAVVITAGGTPRPVLSTTCHDMTFNVPLQRAYCAGVTDTTIWDISDPSEPRIVQVIDWPGTNIHHGVWDARNGTLLILGDEFAGVAAPSPPCSATVSDPTSALWFFDISDLATPLPLGYFQVEWDQGLSEGGLPQYCSTHFGDVFSDRYLVMGWYAAGTVLVDFQDPANARQVAHYRPDGATNTWEARYWNGHVFTGDTARGMDILKLA
jgi:hypothetical protein